jgi:hypothetical protein
MNAIWIGAILAVAGFTWWAFTEWLRGRPHNLERGTQHLVMLGMGGCFSFVAGCTTFIIGMMFWLFS